MEFADIFKYEKLDTSNFSGSVLYSGVTFKGKNGTILLNVYTGEIVFTEEGRRPIVYSLTEVHKRT
jgi:hypothetical protein